MATTPYRTTPLLGPDLTQSEAQFYWDSMHDPAQTGAPTYQLGTKVIGDDGREHVFVKAHQNVSAGDALGVDEATWNTTAGSTHAADADAVSGAYLHVKAATL